MSKRFLGKGSILALALPGVMATVTAVMLAAPPAEAIVNGEPDGDGHPYVGVLVSERDPGVKQRFCSGTLIAPRIVVTAAHCRQYTRPEGHAWVSFEPVYDSGDASPLYHGIVVADPQYGTDAHGDFHDIAVVHLDQAPPIEPAQLPPAGLLSSLDLRGQKFTAVGYGMTRADKTKGPNNIEPNRDPSVRNVAIEEFRSLQPYTLTVSKNSATGDGGTCYGDSGSAHYLGDSNLAVSLTSYGDTACRATSIQYRLDTASARQFLASQGVPLP